MRCLIIICLVAISSSCRDTITDETEAVAFLHEVNVNLAKLSNEVSIAAWNYSTNITDDNAKAKNDLAVKVSKYESEVVKNASNFDTTDFSDAVKRQFKLIGDHPLDEEEETELSGLISQMGEIYGSAAVCLDSSDTCLGLSPELEEIMANSKDYVQRTDVWKGWRSVAGRRMKPLYERYVHLKNKKARLNGYDDYGDQWRSRYEVDGFEQMMLDLYAEVEPLYKELHAYVRRKLYEVYGEEHIDLKGKLPASILGDMWGRFWNNLYRFMIPYPDKPSVDPSEQLRAQNYTVEKMFHTADDFFASMGLLRAPDTFWERSMLRKPDDGRQVMCHATAWDFSDGQDFRIRMCATDYSFGDLNTIHHELGHTQYQQQYKDLPHLLRDGANDGFHEAIGELMAMVGATPRHLHKIGLIKELVEDEEQDINFLLSQSLITISTMPFHLVNDLWRWRIFRGDVDIEKWNEDFWQLKETIAGVKSPVERTADDLDPPTLFHVCQDYDMIRYFTRTILQFQFAEALCKLAGQSGPLYRCDFSGSKEAGDALAKMLQLGRSRSWPEALEQLTGTREMSARPIRQFFQPLLEWLRKTNRANGDTPGWD